MAHIDLATGYRAPAGIAHRMLLALWSGRLRRLAVHVRGRRHRLPAGLDIAALHDIGARMEYRDYAYPAKVHDNRRLFRTAELLLSGYPR